MPVWAMQPWPGWPEPPDRPGPPGWPAEPPTPYPYPPARPEPRRDTPVAVPIVDLPGTDPLEQLFARRRILVSGPLDAGTAAGVAAALMALDGRSSDDVELALNSGGGRLADVVALLDVIGLMRARVDMRCLGRAIGTAAVLLACGTGWRRAAPRAVISLRCGEEERIEGRPDALRHHVDELELLRRCVVAALTAATGQPERMVAEQLDSGPLLDPAAAAELGIIDALERG